MAIRAGLRRVFGRNSDVSETSMESRESCDSSRTIDTCSSSSSQERTCTPNGVVSPGVSASPSSHKDMTTQQQHQQRQSRSSKRRSILATRTLVKRWSRIPADPSEDFKAQRYLTDEEEREEAIRNWQPPHRLKYPGTPDPRTVAGLAAFTFQERMGSWADGMQNVSESPLGTIGTRDCYFS